MPKLFCKLYNNFFVLNPETQKYVDAEYDELLKGKRVLGVLCRGTDFTDEHHIAGHPIQPKIENVIKLAKRKIKKLNLDYIYLATDEKRIEYQFYEAFPNKILVNRRVYVDDVFYSKNCRRISGAIEKKGVDLSFSNLSYLSSICLLARCNALIAGNCGGSEAALCMNNFKYEYWHLFKMGLYKDTI